MIAWLGFIRLIAYILVIMAAFASLKLNKCKYQSIGNIIVASALFFNAFSQIHGLVYVRVTPQFYVINVAVFMWAMFSVLQMSK